MTVWRNNGPALLQPLGLGFGVAQALQCRFCQAQVLRAYGGPTRIPVKFHKPSCRYRKQQQRRRT